MKTYFTKYLPLEGEPEEGDITLLAGEIAPYNKIVPIGLKAGNSELKYQKVKLFLCSRNIKFPEYYHNDKDYPLKHMFGINGDWQNGFKVIGEISPDALSFVKEGQEFEEENLAICWDRAFVPLDTKFDFGKGEIKFEKIIGVKGHCGHFH